MRTLRAVTAVEFVAVLVVVFYVATKRSEAAGCQPSSVVDWLLLIAAGILLAGMPLVLAKGKLLRRLVIAIPLSVIGSLLFWIWLGLVAFDNCIT